MGLKKYTITGNKTGVSFSQVTFSTKDRDAAIIFLEANQYEYQVITELI